MIRFGSRGSELARAQTRIVADALRERTGEDYTVAVIETRGDRDLDTPLAEIGGKGLFTAELEAALLDGRIDVAVHSLKDLPVESPSGLTVGAIPERESPHDVLLFAARAEDPEGGTVPLAGGCRVGTSSPRRRSSLLTLRPDLRCEDIRGNVATRARKVQPGDTQPGDTPNPGYDATILAAAGLARLGLQTPDLRRRDLPTDAFTPAPGQGALGVQCRAGDRRVLDLLAAIHDTATATCVTAERALLERLGGGCAMPLGVLVTRDSSGFRMLVSLFSERRATDGVHLDLRDRDVDALVELAAGELGPLLGEPLAGQRVVLLRPADSDGRLGRALGFAGARVEVVPVSEILPLTEGIAALGAADLSAIAFTSARAVDRFFEQAAAHGLDLRRSACFAGGPATAEAVRRRGLDCEAPGDGAGGGALARSIAATRSPDDGPILFPCAQERHGELESALRAQGFTVRPVPVYRTVAVPGLEIPAADHIVFTSPSAVRAFATAGQPLDHPGLLALGATTAAAMGTAGMRPRGVARAPTPIALVRLVMEHAS